MRNQCPYEHTLTLRDTQYQQKREAVVSSLMESLGRGASTTPLPSPLAAPKSDEQLKSALLESLRKRGTTTATGSGGGGVIDRRNTASVSVSPLKAALATPPATPTGGTQQFAALLSPTSLPEAAKALSPVLSARSPPQQRPLSKLTTLLSKTAQPAPAAVPVQRPTESEDDFSESSHTEESDGECFVVDFPENRGTPKKTPSMTPAVPAAAGGVGAAGSAGDATASVVSPASAPSIPCSPEASATPRSSKTDLDRQLEEFHTRRPPKRERDEEEGDEGAPDARYEDLLIELPHKMHDYLWLTMFRVSNKQTNKTTTDGSVHSSGSRGGSMCAMVGDDNLRQQRGPF